MKNRFLPATSIVDRAGRSEEVPSDRPDSIGELERYRFAASLASEGREVLDLRYGAGDDQGQQSEETASSKLDPSGEGDEPDHVLEEGTGMRIVRCGIHRCQPGRRFQLVLGFGALDRLADHHILFDRAMEHLEPGGRVLVSLANASSSDGGLPVSPVRRLTREQLETILRDRFEEVTWFSQPQEGMSDALKGHRVMEGILPDAAFWLAIGKGPRPKRPNPRVSIVIPVYNRAEFTYPCLRGLAEKTDGEAIPYEVVIVDNGSTDATADLLCGIGGDVVVWRNPKNLGFARGCNQGALLARGDVVVFLNNDTEVHPGWLRPLVDELDAHPETGLVGGRLLYPDGTIQHAGVVIGRDLIPLHIHRSQPADHPGAQERRAYPVVTAACAAVRRREFYALGMFDEGFLNGHEDIDLCFRYREAGSTVVYRPDCVVTHHESVSEGRMASRPHNLERTFRKWRDRFLIQDDFAYSFREADRARPDRPLTFAVKIGPPDRDQTGWGDIYFAECLAKALCRRGHRCQIHYLNEWGRTDLDVDVVLHLKGLPEYRPKPYNLNLLWMLNHPDLHRPEELARYDTVMVSSLSHAESLKRVLPVPVLPLLQATDPEHFRPHPEVPNEFDVVFVGNNHGEGRLGMRRIVADLLPTKLRLGVWGRGWEDKLPAGVFQGELVPWEELPQVYASGRVVLNDHQPEMLSNGFVNNRTFDVLACGARLISDHVKGMEAVLPVPSYQKRSELRRKVRNLLEPDPAEDAQFEALRKRVLENFTFDRRADEILAVVSGLAEARERAEARRRVAPLIRKERSPRVSVLMSTYNRREFLPAAIESVRSQTHGDWELVLVNDGGVSVEDIVTESRDSRIRLLELPEHKGKAYAINRGFEASHEEFIAYLDDDDIWYPDHLESLLLPLLTIPGIEMAYSDAYNVTLEEDGNGLGGYREVSREIRYQHQVTVHDLTLANFIQGISVVHGRRLFSQAGGMDEDLEVLIDWDLWRRLACFSYPYHVSRVTGDHFLRRPSSTSGRGQITALATLDPVRYLECQVRVLSKPLPLPPNSPVRLAQERERVRIAMLACIAKGEKLERTGAMGEARRCYERARRLKADDFAPYRKLAQLDLRENRLEQALTQFVNCINWNSQDVSDYFYASLICLSRRQGPEAVSILDTLEKRGIPLDKKSVGLLEEYRRRAVKLCAGPTGGNESKVGVSRTRNRPAAQRVARGRRP